MVEGRRNIARRSLNSGKAAEILEKGQVRSIYDLISGMMPNDGHYSHAGRVLLHGLLYGLVEMRDRGQISITPGTLRQYLVNIAYMDALCRGSCHLSTEKMHAVRTAMSAIGWEDDRPLDKQDKHFPQEYRWCAMPCLVAVNEIEFAMESDARVAGQDSKCVHRCMRKHQEGREGKKDPTPVACGVMVLDHRKESASENDFRKSLQSVVDTLQHAIRCMDTEHHN